MDLLAAMILYSTDVLTCCRFLCGRCFGRRLCLRHVLLLGSAAASHRKFGCWTCLCRCFRLGRRLRCRRSRCRSRHFGLDVRLWNRSLRRGSLFRSHLIRVLLRQRGVYLIDGDAQYVGRVELFGFSNWLVGVGVDGRWDVCRRCQLVVPGNSLGTMLELSCTLPIAGLTRPDSRVR